MKNRKIYGRILCAVLLCMLLSFIWGNSMLPGKVSGGLSETVRQWLSAVCGDTVTVSGFFIRKLAHFSEFALLGFLFAWLFLLFGQKGIHRFTMPLLCGNLAACVDETIQVLTPQRGPSVVDVWIDTAGVTAGIICLLLGYAVCVRRKHENNNGGI